MRPAVLVLAFCAAITAMTSASSQTLLLNGDFEITASTLLPNGYRQYAGWTENSSAGFIWLEGTNGPSSFDIRSTQFDGASSAAPDPYFPYQSEADKRLDYMGAVRPGTTTFGSLISVPFTAGASIGLDAWRESTGTVSVVNVIRATDKTVVETLTLSSPAQQWNHFIVDTSSFAGTQVLVELRGGTSSQTFGWLTMYDNIAVSAVPEPMPLVLSLAGLVLLATLRQISGRKIS
jgi:hypothetical protein